MTDLWKSLSESLSSIFTSSYSRRQGFSPSSSNRGGGSMDASADGNLSVVPNERTAGKLKGYFDLATEEINKAVRAEEWGLPEDAVTHYTNALAILSEAKMTWTPSTITPSEQKKVEVYRGKITQWYQTVEERLQVLGRREQDLASTSSKKTPLCQPTRRAQKVTPPESAAPYRQNLRKDTPVAGNRRSNPGSPKPNQTSGNNYDDKLVDMITTAIVDRSPAIKWDDVAGLEKAKQALMEMVILPTKRRDLFTGLRKPSRGLLLFGPPGNGKTMLAKAVASESQATFFNVSASSLTSKWVGEAEKLVRTLFSVAISRQPSVIFMDEIDSVMSTRTANENEASRRLKSEFLVQFDGVTSNSNDLVIVIGATNKPQELDDAVLRRLVKRIYVPLPDENVRRLLLRNQLKGQSFSLPGSVIERIVTETEGYSGSDLQALCEEAAMMPIRELGSRILTINANQVRSLKHDDFRKAMTVIRPSLQRSRWEELEEWNREFGSN